MESLNNIFIFYTYTNEKLHQKRDFIFGVYVPCWGNAYPLCRSKKRML
nr:MAG TPA: hypothetical protein [Caudoviricetes sp.]